MALNPSIILQGSNPNLMASFDQGQQAGARSNAIGQQNALAQAYKTDGAGIMSGNTDSLNRLAQIDAPLAMDFRSSQQTLKINEQNASLRAAELARTLDADTRAQASEQFGMGASMLTQAQTPEQFQAIVSRPGFAESAGVLGITPEMLTFENRDTLIASALGAAEAMKLGQPGGGAGLPSAVVELQFRAEGAGLRPGTPEYESFMLNGGGDPATFRALDMQAQRAGYQPGSPEYQDFMATRGAGQQAFARTTGTNTAEIATGGQAAQVVAAGAERGRAEVTSQSEVAEMQRNMPNLLALVDRLDELAGEATFSVIGRGLDTGRRALGFEVSDGGIARAEYTALVDNQILPLLRQTFGAAFTENEGARLRATLGNDEGTPAEKRATLEAFIQQKTRELQARGGNVPMQPAPQGGTAQDVRPRVGTVEDGFRYRGGDPANPASWEQVQ